MTLIETFDLRLQAKNINDVRGAHRTVTLTLSHLIYIKNAQVRVDATVSIGPSLCSVTGV